jgi:hypothetical protein
MVVSGRGLSGDGNVEAKSRWREKSRTGGKGNKKGKWEMREKRLGEHLK